MTDKTGSSSGAPGPARSLYHKERPVARSRMQGLAAGAQSNTPPLSTQPEKRPGRSLLVRHLRALAIAVGGMTALMLLSIAALRGIWAARDRELRASSNTAPTPAVATSGAARASGASGEAESSASEVGVASAPEALSLDTERIRRAVFLAKHAEALEESGSLAEAIARYQEALDVWPSLNSAWGQLGRAYLKARDFAQAQAALEKALQASPNSADLMNDLGAALLYQGQTAHALRLFEAAAEIDPGYALSHFNMALCQLAGNDRVAARASLERFLRMKPNDARALREMAYIDAVESHYDAAMESLQKAMVEAPDWALLYFDSAAVAALMGRMEEAIDFLRKAEPLASPRVVYQIYREAAFRELHLTELGKEFEHEIADRARKLMSQEVPQSELHPASEPLFSETHATPPAPPEE